MEIKIYREKVIKEAVQPRDLTPEQAAILLEDLAKQIYDGMTLDQWRKFLRQHGRYIKDCCDGWDVKF